MSSPRRVVRLASVGLVVGAAALLLGPRARVDEAVVPVDPPRDLDAWLAGLEAAVPGIREGDAKEIVWADPASRARTPLALVYLHGFSADRHEISPVVERVADSVGANVFFTRLTGHGRDGAAMAEATARDWLQDTEEALAVGGRLGERVVLVGTSTGATLALWAAARARLRDRLAAVVLVSPNLGPRDRSAEVLLWPWGGVAARVLVGPERCFEAINPEQVAHWTTCYPTSALLPMMALVDRVRELDPAHVATPVLVLYSPEDAVVDAGRTERFLEGIQRDRLTTVRVEGSDDPAHHVLAGAIVSPSTTDEVVRVVLDFLRTLP